MCMRIKRGEIWSVAWTGNARKPPPALVIQAEEYRLTETDILALITTAENEANAVRITPLRFKPELLAHSPALLRPFPRLREPALRQQQ